MVKQVFISYRHTGIEHARAVRRLAEQLRQAKAPVAFDQFYMDEHPGGPNEGWPKWCEDNATKSDCIIVIASQGWFDAYERVDLSSQGLGCAMEADLIRQHLYAQKGQNARVRLVFIDKITIEHAPLRLKSWHSYRPFDVADDFSRLVGWVGECLELTGLRPAAVQWPGPVAFDPDLANRDEKEWPAIVDLLSGRSSKRILLFEGASGVGKSCLIHQVRAYSKQSGVASAYVNMKGGGLDIEAILGRMHLEFNECLPNFSRDPANLKSHILFSDLRALTRPLLIIFDHYEDTSRLVVDWLNQQLLPEVDTSPGLLLIIAGQKSPDSEKAIWGDAADRLRLLPITEIAAWRSWAQRCCPAFLERGGDLRTILLCTAGHPSQVVSLCKAAAGE